MNGRRMACLTFLAASLIGGLWWLSMTAGGEAAAAQKPNLELTVYNQNLALVKDRRLLILKEGLNRIRFADVAALIDPTSVHFRSLDNPEGTRVLEQNYEYDLVSTQKLLQKYVDAEISLVTQDGTLHEGTLLSGAQDIILEEKDGRITVVKLDQVREFSFPSLPEGLITRPTLVWEVETDEAGAQRVEVTYLTEGINWRADYIAVVNADDTAMDLTGWVTVDNRSGATYRDARLKLIAGDIRRIRPPAVVEGRVFEKAMVATAAPQFEEKPFFEYHLYTLQRPTTIKDNQTKQIEFASATEVPLRKIFVYDGSQGLPRFYGRPLTDQSYGIPTNTKVAVVLEFTNSVTDGLGIPLPKGTIRVYKQNAEGGSEFIGEDQIDHTPKDEQIRLNIGNAFDIVGERKQTNFKRLGDRVLEESYEITLRNHKDEAVEVRVVERLFRWSEWEIVRSSPADYTKLDAQTIEFRVRVPAGGERKVTYTVRYEF